MWTHLEKLDFLPYHSWAWSFLLSHNGLSEQLNPFDVSLAKMGHKEYKFNSVLATWVLSLDWYGPRSGADYTEHNSVSTTHSSYSGLCKPNWRT